MRKFVGTSCGAALMCAGIMLLALVLLPPVCWLFAAGVAMVLIGHSLVNRNRWM